MTTNSEQPVDAEQLLDVTECAQWLKVSCKTIRRWSEQGHFPQPVRLGDKLVRWKVSALRAWVDDDCSGGWLGESDESDESDK